MDAAYTLVIRNGTVMDGTGRAGFAGDVAIAGDRIAAVGKVEGRGAEEIDAAGLMVTPGFVDIHTHYDGQAVWDSHLTPSSWHGVTTVVMGNCGVGFAPVKPHDRDRLIALMEGVEDIPAPALHEGLAWNWESFADYLAVLDQRPRDVDICAQLPHGPLRVFVMGERAGYREIATDDDRLWQQGVVGDQGIEPQGVLEKVGHVIVIPVGGVARRRIIRGIAEGMVAPLIHRCGKQSE